MGALRKTGGYMGSISPAIENQMERKWEVKWKLGLLT